MELRAAKYPDVISLAQGIPSFDTPGCIKRRVERALRQGVVARYSLSPGLPELRELIEIALGEEKMYYDWEKEIIVTAGSIEGITAAVLAITEPGDEIIIPEPTYTSYREVVNLAGCRPVFVPLDEKRGWSLSVATLAESITPQTKAILYCNPNNPTGTIYTKDQLIGLAKLAEEHDLYLISDEVYKDFIYPAEMSSGVNNDEAYFTLAMLPEYRKRVIRIYSFSKAYAMTGWRIGYLHSDESVVAEILKVHDSLVTCAPVISQYAAMGALEMGEVDIKRFNREYMRRLELICGRLDRLNRNLSYIRPNCTYYVFPKINPVRNSGEPFDPAGIKPAYGSTTINPLNTISNGVNGQADSWQFALELLDKVQVAVVPGAAFGPSGEGHIRLSFGRSEEHINLAFDRLERYFEN